MSTILDLKIWPDPILNQTAKNVDVFDEELTAFVENMFLTMRVTNGIGLAANQVGDLRRVIVLDTTPIPGGTLNQEFINPRIVETPEGDEKASLSKEGCLSFPGAFVTIKRYETLAVEAENKDGETFTVVADGIDAMCLQHEIDHLDGITFYDRLSNTAKRVHAKKFAKVKKWKKKNGK